MTATLLALLATGLAAGGGLLTLRLHRERGREPDPAHLAMCPRYRNGRFENEEPVPVSNMGPRFYVKFFLSRHRPPRPLPVTPVAASELPRPPAPLRAVWMGHSFVLVDVDGARFLFDPVYGPATPLPVNMFRFQAPPLPREQLPDAGIDAVIVTHDHYDHLERSTLCHLARKGLRIITPLGVGARLRGWGCPADSVTELDWHQSTDVGTVRVTATPARHFSGRSLNSRDGTLWASWVLRGPEHGVFFSADGGYGRHFAAIGKQYGPFDLACMETGAWDKRWPHAHQQPEESVRACREVGGRVMLPIHWAAYDLSFHPWDEPILRASTAAREQGVPLATPRMGEAWSPGMSTGPWWTEVR